MSKSLFKASIKSLHTGLINKDFSSVELTNQYLDNIEQNTHLNAYIHVNRELAILSAKDKDNLLKKEKNMPLLGIPMAHKDLFCTTAMPTTAGSKMLENYQSPFNATMVDKLNQQGVVILGKTNMDEFAMGSSNENSYFGHVKNPWNLNHVPGGSSGGSAVAVAAHLAVFATGSDTGGSVRQPAALCGICGLKPTYGLISRYGMIAYASSLESAGPMAKSAEDLAIVLQAMQGFDAKDSTSINKPVPNYLEYINTPLKGIKIGIPTSFFTKDVDTEILEKIHDALEVYEKLGAKIIEVELNTLALSIPCYYVIACAEASSNLARFDGIRYGFSAKNSETIEKLITNSRSVGFGLEVKRRILTGTFVLSSGYFDAYYLQALKIRRMIAEDYLNAFKKVDVLIGPTSPCVAKPIGMVRDNPIEEYLADIFTVGVNLAGLPALSIPAGFSNKLPIGMQLIAPHFQESRLLNLAHIFQQHTNWHKTLPEEL